ncbi:MAG: hypothetical protein H6983_15975 [Ectothiorhodospiraceae bacterium]|nr:hypothetical protein [Ectothiorhodospiraceae bacterium]
MPAIGVVAMLIASAGAAWAESAPTGHDVLRLCGGPAAMAAPPPTCVGYFEGALDAAGTELARRRLTACPPPAFGAVEAAALFALESRRFPEALDAPAADLVAGMLLKFFPCTGV